MDVFVPERVLCTNGDVYYNYMTNHQSVTNFCIQTGARQKVASYFYDTRLRTVNDCVHGKLVNPQGIVPKILSSKLYSNTWMDPDGYSTARCWKSSKDYTILMVVESSGPAGTAKNPTCQRAGHHDRRVHTIKLYVFFPRDPDSSVLMRFDTGRLVFTCIFDPLVVEMNDVPVRYGNLLRKIAWRLFRAELDWVEACGIHPRDIPSSNGIWGKMLYDVLSYSFEDIVAVIDRSLARQVTCRVIDGLPEGLGDPKALRSRFKFHEPEIIAEGIDPLLVNRAYMSDNSSYWRNWLIQHAFLDACNNIPRLNDNSISNVIEIVQFIHALVNKRQIEMPRSLSDLWLSYRYVYNTTKLDAEEAVKFVHRHMDILGDYSHFRCHGESSRTFDDGTTVTCRCSFDIKERNLSKLQQVFEGLYRYGLEPNFYVIWDMIPYSFMVDWFLPIGDAVSVLDARRHYNGDNYDFEHICYSLSYVVKKDGYYSKHYARWDAGSTPPELQSYYWFDKEKSTSDRIIGYRVLDALSIFLG